MGVAMVGETPSLKEESSGGSRGILKCTQTHQPRNQHQKGTISLWVAGEVTESRVRAKQCCPSLTPPPQCSKVDCPVLVNR